MIAKKKKLKAPLWVRVEEKNLKLMDRYRKSLGGFSRSEYVDLALEHFHQEMVRRDYDAHDRQAK